MSMPRQRRANETDAEYQAVVNAAARGHDEMNKKAQAEVNKMTSTPVRSKFATDAITRYAKATKATDGGAKFGAAYDKAQQARAAAAKPAATAAAKPAATAAAKPAAKSMVSDARRAELSANYKKNYAAATAAAKAASMARTAAKKTTGATTAVQKATGGYVTKSTFKW
jgi:hypothetical protein